MPGAGVTEPHAVTGAPPVKHKISSGPLMLFGNDAPPDRTRYARLTGPGGGDDDYACSHVGTPKSRTAANVCGRSNGESPAPIGAPSRASPVPVRPDHGVRQSLHTGYDSRDCGGGTPARSRQDRAMQMNARNPVRWPCCTSCQRVWHRLRARPASDRKAGRPIPWAWDGFAVYRLSLSIPSDCFTNRWRRTVTGVPLRGTDPPDIMRAGPSSRSGGQTVQGTMHGP